MSERERERRGEGEKPPPGRTEGAGGGGVRVPTLLGRGRKDLKIILIGLDVSPDSPKKNIIFCWLDCHTIIFGDTMRHTLQ